MLEENKISIITTDSAIGIISLIGYTPDVFMGSLVGYVLDISPGKEGHQQLFIIMAVFSGVGLLASLCLDF